jgi:predicted P-loop ATPase/GTPase
MRVLLAGMNSFDSGKTQFAIRLSKLLSNEYQSLEYFKPVSGHNYWYKHEHTKVCMNNGLLASLDAIKVRETLNTKIPLELANPVHSLFVPMRLEKPMQNLTNTLGLSGSSSILVMERFSRPDGSSIDTTVLLAQKLVEEERLIIGLDEVGMLSRGASIQEISNLEEVQEFERLYFEQYVSEAFVEVEGSADAVVIEGFNNSAWPWEGLKTVDIVLLVSPGHVFSFDPERFRKASFLMNRGNQPIREVTFSRISDLLKPLGRLELRPDSDLTHDDIEQLGISFRTGKKD